MARMKAPRGVRERVEGKILAAEALTEGQWAVISTAAFTVVTPAGEVEVARPWHEVAIGEWDGDRHVLTVSWVDGSAPTRIRTQNPTPIHFPRIFKERVDASVVYSETIPVPGGVLRGALRRTPAGELISQISSDGDLLNTPELESQIAALEHKLWEFVGL